jgi:hypothetical protein
MSSWFKREDTDAAGEKKKQPEYTKREKQIYSQDNHRRQTQQRKGKERKSKLHRCVLRNGWSFVVNVQQNEKKKGKRQRK